MANKSTSGVLLIPAGNCPPMPMGGHPARALLCGIGFAGVRIRLNFALRDGALADLPDRARGELDRRFSWQAVAGEKSAGARFGDSAVDGVVKRVRIGDRDAGFDLHAKDCAAAIDNRDDGVVPCGSRDGATEQVIDVGRGER